MEKNCIFCKIQAGRDLEKVAENGAFFAVRDLYPIALGHTLVISKRHYENIFEADPKEAREMLLMLKQVKENLDRQYSPQGYNVTSNIGTAAGQTVFHLHIHIIPRYRNDSLKPEAGGVHDK